MRQGNLLAIIRNDPRAFYLALALHGIILAVVLFSVDFSVAPELQHKEIETVQAVVVDSKVVQAEMDKIRQHEQKQKNAEQRRLKQLEDKAKREEQRRKAAEKKRRQEEKRLADLKRKREADEKARKEQARKLAELEAEKKRLEEQRQAEQQRLAAIQKKREEEEAAQERARQQEAERKRREAEAAALRQRLAEEERERVKNSARVKKLTEQYVKLIERHVQKKWQKPASATAGMYCEVLVRQNRAGTVENVRTTRCEADSAFQRSVESAVLRSSPLPDPPAPEVFEREIRFIFRPE